MFLRIVANQARQKWAVTTLLWLAMTAVVSLYVYLANSARFSNRSMQLIMKRMGHNLLILPRRARPLDTYLCTDRQVLFSADVPRRLAAHLRLPSKYYVAVLQERVSTGEATVLLTGIEPVARADETREKGNMVTAIPRGHARLGSEAALLLDADVGGDVTVRGRTFRVGEVLAPQGRLDDYRVYVPLSAAQELLGRPGKINAVRAFLCMHAGDLARTLEIQRRGMAKQFADFKVVTRMDIAQGRALARQTTSRYLSYLLTIVLAITVVAIVVTGLQEVWDRRRETGILLAMGTGYAYIVALYVVKLLVIAAAASGAGFVIGSCLSRLLLAPVLVVQTRGVAIVWRDLPRVVGLTCLVAVAAELLPMVKLVRMDPNAILAEE